MSGSAALYVDGEGGEVDQPWRFKDIRWRQVFKRQDFANWCVAAAWLLRCIKGGAWLPRVPWWW